MLMHRRLQEIRCGFIIGGSFISASESDLKYWGLDDKFDYTLLSGNEKASWSITAPWSHCGGLQGLHEPKLWAIPNLRPNRLID